MSNIRMLMLSLLPLLALPSGAAESANDVSSNAITGTIVEVGYGYGNLQTDIPIATLTIEPGETFIFACREQSFTSTWVAWYSDVPEGSWLGLAGAGDNVQIAISFGDANAESGCVEGDEVSIVYVTG